MEQKTLNAESRARLGKGESGRLKRRGRIPAVIYGHQEPLAVSIDAHEFDTKFHHISESTIIRLAVGGQEREVLIRDFQEDAWAARSPTSTSTRWTRIASCAPTSGWSSPARP
jgi:large subunit ribosomal protein L25